MATKYKILEGGDAEPEARKTSKKETEPKPPKGEHKAASSKSAKTSASKPKKRTATGGTPKVKVLEERTERREGFSEDSEENPYWASEEPEPHPNPELGCVRRNLCCKSNPGWFVPHEVEKAAELLGMTPDAFVKAYVVIDHFEVGGRLVEAFVPVKMGRDGNPLIPTATRTDRLYQMLRSPCVFFNGSGCDIYDARPYECRLYVCTEPALDREKIARQWMEPDSEG